MNVIESIFREYDIRGTYPSEINEDVMSIIGQAIALKCKEEGVSQISVGRDGRLSGETLLNSMCDSLARSGILLQMQAWLPALFYIMQLKKMILKVAL